MNFCCVNLCGEQSYLLIDFFVLLFLAARRRLLSEEENIMRIVSKNAFIHSLKWNFVISGGQTAVKLY